MGRAQVIKAALKEHGYEVLIATEGQDALRTVAYQEPDLVLLNVEMPGLDGCEICRRIRRFSSVPIIMLTMAPSPADRVNVLRAGADQCLSQPCYVREIIARIQALLRRTALSRKRYHIPPDQLPAGWQVLPKSAV